MNILVTGATGFLGTHLCRALEARGDSVVRLNSSNADLRRPDSLDGYNTCRYDVIYHLAAWTQAGDFCLAHPGEQWIVNQQINTHVLAWWQNHHPQAKLVAMGTSCSYAPDRELLETDYMEGTPIDSLYTYAMTKRMLYVGLQALSRQFNLNYLYLVPSTLYGPGYHTQGKQMHFIFDLIRKIVDGKRRGTPVILWGDGQQKRELVYIDDFTAITLALTNRVANEIVNIGGGHEHSIRWFAEQICALVGYDPALIQYDTSRYVGAKSKVLNIDKLQRLVPEFHPTALEDGLEKTVRWFEKEYGQ
ncbi:MAG: NAD-dependent epimerase/dehydratase family protein [Kiritimatiellae bacterium]|nr:NAD-dependent epimerase/dehydratase family protein [Kiritimatiellia bacterium]